LLIPYFRQYRYRVLGRPKPGPQSCTQSRWLNLLSLVLEVGRQMVPILDYGISLMLTKPVRKSRYSMNKSGLSMPAWNPSPRSAGRIIRRWNT
jgi:hypothetical protein